MPHGLARTALMLALSAAPAAAQTTIGWDLSAFSAYDFRGVRDVNRFVLQPNVYAAFPVGSATFTLAGWGNIEPGKYQEPEDLAIGDGPAGPDLSEVEPYLEVSFTTGLATVVGGATGYFFPNSDLAPRNKKQNTWEVFGKLGFGIPLNPQLSIYYDVDEVNGAYLEGSVSHEFRRSHQLSFQLAALSGFSVGQDCEGDIQTGCSNGWTYQDNGPTHLDLSASAAFDAGAFSIAPTLHFVVNFDEATRITRPDRPNQKTKVWFGATVSWSKTFGVEPE